MVADAGKFGYVHLTWFNGTNFEGSNVYTDSKELFEDLWTYWKEFYLLEPVKKTPLTELGYDELYAMLSEEKKKEFENKRQEFWLICFGDE